MSQAKALRALKSRKRKVNSESITADEGREAIRAFRRGVGLRDIAAALGKKNGTNVYLGLGVWCLRHCNCAGSK